MTEPKTVPAAEPRVVLDTGGASGIGLAVVREFVATGDHVVVLDREAPAGDVPGEVTFLRGDVCDAEDNERAVATAVERYGRLDVFVGNAGIHDGGYGIRDLDAAGLAEVTRRVFEVDVIGYLLGAKASAEALIASRGCMVFTLSDASFVVRGVGAGIGYAVAKHAGLGLVRHLAADLAPDVRVNAVAPGGTVTGLQAATAGAGTRDVFDDPEAATSSIRRLNPLGVVLTPQQIAALYVFLASPAALAMTGEVLRPDGGLDVR